ncbi:MAG TPA: hypothetical protein VEK33_05930 [Terriglobales bacterium]|nr:hypothetical protein [Terriglobales bacterium]
MSEWTPKKAAILGLVFAGTSVVFFSALLLAMYWEQGSSGRKNWGIVFAAAFGVPFMCCGIAAVLSFVVSVSLITYKRFFGFRQASPVALASEPPRRKVRHPAVITFAGFAVLIASARFGTPALFFVGIPAMLIACAVAGGARSPTKIPLRDAILYVGISVAIVVGITLYAVYHH